MEGNTVEPLMGDADRRSDRDLIQRFRGGDREAFLTLYRAHSPAVLRFAFYMTADCVRAEEVTQDVFVWLIHHAGYWNPDRGDLPAFLGGVARKFLHRQQRTERRWLPLDESAAGSDAFSGDLEREQEAAGLRKAIAALPVPYREAVVLCDLEGMSYEEAAAVQGCAVGTVRSRLHRARQLLARKYQCRKEGERCV